MNFEAILKDLRDTILCELEAKKSDDRIELKEKLALTFSKKVVRSNFESALRLLKDAKKYYLETESRESK